MRRSSRFLLVLLLGGLPALAGDPEVNAQERRSLLDEAWRFTRDHFVNRNMNGLDWDAIHGRYVLEVDAARTRSDVWTVINSMLAELDASHTRLYTPNEPAYYELLDLWRDYYSFAEHSSEQYRTRFPFGVSYEGIGIVTQQIDDDWFVTGIVDGTPAQRSNIQLGDEILSADGKPFHPIDSFVGKAETEVILEVRRSPDPADPLRVSVHPERLQPKQMYLDAIAESSRVLSWKGVQVGYLRVWAYTGDDFHKAVVAQVTGHRLDSAEVLVLDLRGGWGGASPEYLNLFNPKLPILSGRRRNGQWADKRFSWRKPVVLLVNEATRSGKEFFAFGFKAYKYGPVVGTRTAGAGFGAEPLLLSDGSLLTVAALDSRLNGQSIEGAGVVPDVVIPVDLRHAAGRDLQLERAMDVAVDLVSSAR